MGTDTTTAGAFGTATGTQKLIFTGTLPTITNGTLAAPNLVLRNLAANSDANFATIIATHGVQLHAATTVNVLTASAATSIADISAASVIGAASTPDDFSVYALRTSANIDGTDTTDTLKIVNGGLILNGAAGPVLGGTTSFNLTFGTGAAANAVDAYVYVREGQSSIATIAANFTAADFIKSGAGNLLISGSANVMQPPTTGTSGLRTMFVQEGQLRFASANAVPTAGGTANGGVNLMVNDTGTLDLNGLGLAFGSLSGTGFVTNNSATAGVLTLNMGRSQAQSFNGVIRDGAGTVGLVKSGVGEFTVATPVSIGNVVGSNDYSGGTVINAGLIMNADTASLVPQGAAANLVQGRLNVANPLALGTGPITLAGGILSFTNPVASIEVVAGLIAQQFGPGAGYDLTVAATNNFGTPNVTSVIVGPTGGAAAALNNLTVNSSAVTFLGGLNDTNSRGTIFAGTVNLTQPNTFLNVGYQTLASTTAANALTIAGNLVANGGAGTVTKVGPGWLMLNEWNQTADSQVAAWTMSGGAVELRGASAMFNMLGANATLTLNDVSLNTRYDGDGTESFQVISTHATNNVVVGSLAGLTAAGFIGSRNVTIDNRANNTGSQSLNQGVSNKTIVFGNLAFGGALGSPYLTVSTGTPTNAWTATFSQFGNLTMTKNAYLNLGSETTLTGVISGNGTLYKQNSNLFVAGDSSAFLGGYVNNGGTTFFGTRQGQLITLSDTAKVTSGNILIQPGSAIQFNSINNVPAGWTGELDLRSRNSNFPLIRIAGDFPLTAINLRVGGLGGAQDFTSFMLSTAPNAAGLGRNPGTVLVNLNTVYTQNLDLAKIGDGTAFLGSTTNSVGQVGTYNGTALGVGAGNTYRFGAGGTTLYVGSNGATNVLTDRDARNRANLLVGTIFTSVNQLDNIGGGNGRGTTVLLQNQNYSGSTIINLASTLDVRGTLATRSVENFGNLLIGGLGGTLVNAGGTANIMASSDFVMRPGSSLRFDYSTGVLPEAQTEASGGQGRWHDAAPITLDTATLQLFGNRGFDITERVGVVTGRGGNILDVRRDANGRVSTLLLSGLVQTLNYGALSGNNATFDIRGTVNPEGITVGAEERVVVVGGLANILSGGVAATITNGMLPPWIVNRNETSFLTYVPDLGFVNAGYDTDYTAATTVAANILTPNSRTRASQDMTISDGVTLDVYALMIQGDRRILSATPASSILAGSTLQVRSGGIIFRANTNTNNPAITAHRIIAGDGITPTDLYLWGRDGTRSFDLGLLANANTTGQLTNVRNLIFNGANNLELVASQQTFAGNIILNAGNVVLRTAATSGTVSPAGTGSIIVNAPNAIVYYRPAGAVTFLGNLIVGENNPRIQVNSERHGDTGADVFFNVAGGIRFLGATGEQGQTVQFRNGGNKYSPVYQGALNLGPEGNNAYLSVWNDTDRNIITFTGQVTADGTKTARLIKTGDGDLRLANISSLNDWSGGLVVAGGNNTRVVGTTASNLAGLNPLAAGGLGNGDVTLFRGQLQLRYDGAGATYDRLALGQGPNSVGLVINGSANVEIDRNSAGSNKLLSFRDLTIGNYELTVNQAAANGYALDIFGKTFLRGNARINNSVDMVLNGDIDDNGAGLTLFKNAGGALWINGTNANFTGGLVASGYQSQNATIRFGNYGSGGSGGANTGNRLATLGSGQIRMTPNSVIHLEDTTNIAGNRQLKLASAATHFAVVALRPNTDNLNANNFTQSYLATLLTTDSSGVLALQGNAVYTRDLDQSAIGNGRMYLGGANLSGVTANATYAAASLAPGSDGVYRLGGASGTLTLDFNTTTSTVGALVDGGSARRVLIGDQGQFGTGTVQFNDLNTYTGGTVISRGSTLIVTQSPTATSGPLGLSGTVDVFGMLTLASSAVPGPQGSLLSSTDATQNAYGLVMHPGSRLEIGNWEVNPTPNTMVNRYGDSTPLTLNGAMLRVLGPNSTSPTLASPEVIGDLNIAGGSTLGLYRRQGNGAAALTVASLNRVGFGTLTLETTDPAFLGVANGTNNNLRFLVSGTAPTATNAMVDPWMISWRNSSFLDYTTLTGFRLATFNTTVTTGAFPAGLIDATAKVSVTTADTFLRDNPTVYALRTDQNLRSGTGQFNTLTIVSGGLITGAGNTGTNTIDAHLRFGATGTGEALWFTGNSSTTQFNGDITASRIVKFGTGILSINKDQTDAARGAGQGLTADWHLNQGRLNFEQFGAAGTGNITIWGTQDTNNLESLVRMDGGNQTTALLGLYADPTSMLAARYSFGTIFVKDQARIYLEPAADDRTIQISNLSFDSSDTTGLVPARVRFETPRPRTMVIADTVSLTGGNTALDLYWTGLSGSVEGFNRSSGIGTGLSIASLNNGGVSSRGLLKWGNAMLFVRGDSSTTFNGPVTIDTGAIQVNHDGSLGTGAITVNRFGVLDINKAAWVRSNSALTYNEGSAERWSIDGARNGQNINLGQATLQINADQFTASGVTVRLNGGGVEGWLRADDLLDGTSGVIFRTIGSGVGFQLDGDSFVGLNFSESYSGLDAGRLPTYAGFNDNNARGVMLEILGGFSGTGRLTKRGLDTVTLSGAMTHTGGTHVTMGALRLGAVNILPATGAISTANSGVLDLNGFAQIAGALSSNSADVPGVTSGFIVNGATNTVALTVGNGSSAATTYNGLIQTNVALVKTGAGSLTLTNANTYVGGTTINQGTLVVANTGVGVGGSATGTGVVTVSGGALAGNGSIGAQVVLNSGSIRPGLLGTAGRLDVAGLTINGGSLAFRLDAPTSTTDDIIRITAPDASTSLRSFQLNGALTGIDITALAGFKVGTYALIDYSAAGATLGGSFNTAFGGVLSPLSPSSKFFLQVIDNTVDKRIDLLVQANTSVVWSGLGNRAWKLGNQTPQNWRTLAGSATAYADGFDVVFNDVGTGRTIELDAEVKPLSVTFSGSGNYVLQPGPTIRNPQRITDKSVQPLSVTANGTTLLTGFTALEIADLTPGMSVTGTNIPAGTLIDSVDEVANTVTLSQAAGTGTITNLDAFTKPSLTKNGTGTLTISTGTNEYSGGTFLNAGTLVLGASSSGTAPSIVGPLGSGTVHLLGGTLSRDASLGVGVVLNNNLILGGNVTFASTAPDLEALVFEDAGTTATLTTTPTLTVLAKTVFNMPITGAGRGFVKEGTGELELAKINTYNGLTTVNNGLLNITGALASGNAVTVGASGTVDFNNLSNGAVLGVVTNAGQVNFTQALSSSIATLNGAASGDVDLVSGATLNVTAGNYPGIITGAGSLVKVGGASDNLVLSNAGSTFSGGLSLKGGSFAISGSTALSSGAVTAGPLGTGLITIEEGGGSISVSGGAQTLHNRLSIGANLGFSGTDLTFAESGVTSPSVPTITLAGSSVLNLNITSNVVFDQQVTGAASAGLIKSGGGVLRLAKTNNDFTAGSFTVQGGVLEVASLGGLGDSLGNTPLAETGLIISGNANLRYVGSNTSTSSRLFSVNAGGATLENSGTGTLVLNNTGALTMAGDTSSVRTLTLAGTATTTNSLSALIGNSGGSAVSLVKSGTGTWRLAGTASTFTGTVSVQGGVLEVASLANGGSPSSLGSSTNVATNLTLSGGGVVRWVGATNSSSNRLFQIASNSSGGIEASGSGVLNLTNTGSFQVSATDQDATVLFGGTGGSFATPNTFAGILANRGTGVMGLTKTGNGAWKFTGNSTMTGVLRLNGGRLVVDTLTNGGIAGPLGAAGAQAANLILGGGTLTYGGAAVSFDRLFTLAPGNSGIESSGTGALTFTGSASANTGQATVARSLTLGGTFDGANIMSLTFADAGTGLTSLAKAGAGTWTLTGASTFTGGTTIENGHLLVTNAAVSAGGLGNGSSAANVVRLGNANSTGDVRLSLGNQGGSVSGLNLANPIVVSDLNASGNAIVASTNISGTNALTGPITLGATADTGKSLTLAVAAGGTLAVGGQIRANGTNTTAGITTLNTTGSGNATITLSAANTYAGGTTVGANTTVIVNDTAALGANSAGNALNLAGGILRYGNVRFAAGVQQSYRQAANDLASPLSAFTSFGVTSNLKMANILTSGTSGRSVASITDTLWGSNETWAYSGQIFIPNGTQVSFGENVDDVAFIRIGSTTVMNNTAATTASNGGTFTITGGVDGGWHTFEARFGNGTGGAGAVANTNWGNGFGVGISGMLGKALTTSADATNFAQLSDAGMTLFRYDRGAVPTLVLTNAVNVSADSTLDLGSDIGAISLGALTLNGSKLTTAATTTTYANHTFTFAGTSLTGLASLASNATSTINLGALNDAGTAATLTFDGAGTLVMNTAATSLVAGSVIAVNGGKIVSSEGTALANVRVNVGASGLFELAANQTIAGLGGAGSVTLNSRTLTIGAADGLTTTFSGVISDGTGAGALIKAGTGVLTLSGNNSFVGALTVNAGTLQVGHVSALGTTAAGTTVATGATLDLNGIAMGAEAIALSGRLANTSATAASLSGAVTLGGAAELGSDAGTLTLTGGVDLGANALTVNGAGNVVFSGSAGLTGTGLVTKNGTGALTLNAASTADFAAINAGAVTMAANLNVGALNGGSVNVGAHTLNVTTATTVASDVTSLRFAGGQLNYAGTTALDRSFTVADGGVKLTANATARIEIGVASKVDFADTTGTGRTLTLAGTSSAGNAYGASLFDSLEATDRLFTSVVKEGVGAWIMRGTGDTFASTATFDLTAGLLGFTSGALGSVGSTGDVIVRSSSSLRWEAGNTDDLSGRISVPTGNVATLVFSDAASPVTFSSALDLQGTAAVRKTGTGTLVLAAANTFTQGGLAVQQGTVQVTAVGGLGSGVERAVVSSAINPGTQTQLIVDSLNVTAGVTAGTDGRVSGSGSLGAVDINAGGTIASGNSTGGTLTVASLKLAPSANMEWRVWDASLGAGVGYSRLSVTGALDLSTGDYSTNKISLKLISLSAVGGSVNTIPTGFDPPAGTQRSFTLAQVGSVNYGVGSTNISDYFSVDVSQFKYSDGSASAAGLWSISFDNANSAITLTAVPEPSTYGFGLGALALAAAAIRRRRQVKKA